MTRPYSISAVLVAAALAVGAAGCGSGGGSGGAPPKGSPDLRNHGPAVQRLEQVETVRASLVSAENLYDYFHHVSDARHQLALGREAYQGPLSDAVRARKHVLDREIKASFETVDALLAAERPAPSVNFRLDLLRNQLLEAALDAGIHAAARNDPTVTATALMHFTAALDASYSKSARLGRSDAGRQEFQTAYGLLARSQFLCKQIDDALGPQQKKACGPISAIRNKAFPFGVGRPRAKAPKPLVVHRKVLKSQGALAQRFGI